MAKLWTTFRSSRRAGAVLAALCGCVLLASCRSTPKDPEDVYSSVNYSDADVLRDELAKIDVLSASNPIKALWRTATLASVVAESDGVRARYDAAEQAVIAAYEAAVSAQDYLEALRCYESLAAVGSRKVSALAYSSARLEALLRRDVPGLTAPASSSGRKVAECIKGTVTVYVDKGIKIERGRGSMDAVLGSGFFISKDGYLITNHHVISDCVDPAYEGFARLYVMLAEDPDTRIPARIVGWDSVLDLALLKTEVDAPYVFALGSSTDLEVGDRVYAIGSPLGLDRTLTSGIISATDRDLFTLGKVFQIDAAVNSGNSGGPLIDGQGRVQAVVFAGVQNYQGLNFAIPVEYLRAELPILYRGGERTHPWLEAYGKTRRLPGSGAKNEGLEVLYVMPGGSAFLSGLADGQTIVSLNGKPVTSIDDLHGLLIERLSGGIVRVGVRNEDGSTAECAAYLAERPRYPGYEIYRHDLLGSSMLPILGMSLVRVSTSNKNVYSVSRIIKGTAADQAGFSEDDPVQILKSQLAGDKSSLYLELLVKKRKNGYLDMSLGLTMPLDGLYYF